MHRLSPSELKSRLRMDYQVCQGMFGSLFSGEAYRTTSDMERRINQIISAEDAHLATKYYINFYVKTLIGPDRFTDITTIGFNLDVYNYPYDEPATWLISPHVPYSPHFKNNAPVCIGDIWQSAQGHMLLGQLFVHIARLLNWDGTVRGGGYVGWNAEAVAYYNKVYRGRPITEDLRYPVLPSSIYGIKPADETPLFRPIKRSVVIDASLFKGKGRV